MTKEKSMNGTGIVPGTNGYLVDKSLKGMLAVSIFMMFGATISMSIDSILAGNLLGQDALATMSAAMPLFVAISMLSSILANGGSTLASRALGENDEKKVNAVFTLVVLVDIAIAFILMACIYPNMQAVASFIGAREEPINSMTVAYIRGLMVGVIPMMLSSTFLYFIRITGNPQLGLITTLIMAVVDVAGDYILAGPLKMGTYGLALATSASYWVPFVISVLYVIFGKCSLRLAKPTDVWRSMASVVNLGMPSALTSLCNVVKGIVFNLIAAALGVRVLSTIMVQGSVCNIVGCVTLGVGSAVMPLAGIFFGEQDENSLIKTVKKAVWVGVLLNTILAVATFVLAKPLAGMFHLTDPESVQMGVRSIRYYALSMPFAIVSYVLISHYQCTKRVWMANVIILGKGMVFSILFAVLGKNAMGDNALWVSGVVSEVLALVLIYVVICVYYKTLRPSLKDFFMLPKEWEQQPPCYEVSLRNDIGDAVTVSENVHIFCKENGVSDKTAYFMAVCLEEMVTNTIQYGFKDQKEHFIDIKVQAIGEGAKLRIRDDGAAFNPMDYLKEQDSDDLIHNIGIRMVKEIAKEVDYRNTMRMNNLFIES